MAELRDVLALAKRGVPVFPLRPGTKDGFVNSESDHGATTDTLKIFDWFKPNGPYAGYNYGCLMGGRHLAVDVDSHNDGIAAWQQAMSEMGGLEPTLVVKSANGGLHYYFETGGEVFSQADLIKGKVNIRAAGGYVVGPGSTFNGKPYSVAHDAPIAKLPDSLRQRLRTRSTPTEGPRVASDLDAPDAVQHAKNRLAWALPAIEGQSGDNNTFKLACSLYDFGVSYDTCFSLMWELWNARCLPPWPAEDLKRICANAWAYKQDPIGRDNPIEGFSGMPTDMIPLLAAPQPVAGAGGSRKLLKYANEITLDAIVARESRALVKGLINPGETSLIYGVPTSGKTFAMIDMNFAIAQGRLWHGLRTRQAPALYVGLEGVEGLEKRILAATKVHGDPGLFFSRLAVHVSLIKGPAGEEGARTIVEAYRQLAANAGSSNPGIITIDTFARATAGDNENDTADMMAFIEHRAGYLARETGAAIVVVHHPNKQGGIRGSGSLEGACEVTIRAEKDEATGARRLVAEKVKDGKEGELFAYDLKIVQLGADADGAAITSCVVEARAKGGLSERQQQCLDLTKEMMHEAIRDGKRLSPSDQATNYAPKWLHKTQKPGMNFTKDEFKDALKLAPIIGIRTAVYENKGKKSTRYEIAGALPTVGPPDASTGAPTLSNACVGPAESLGNSAL